MYKAFLADSESKCLAFKSKFAKGATFWTELTSNKSVVPTKDGLSTNTAPTKDGRSVRSCAGQKGHEEVEWLRLQFCNSKDIWTHAEMLDLCRAVTASVQSVVGNCYGPAELCYT